MITMQFVDIQKAQAQDIPSLGRFYSDVVRDMDAKGVHQWKLGEYPTERTAAEGIEEGSLYLTRREGRIAASIILNQNQDEGYKLLPWKDQSGKCLVVHTLCVHPDFAGQGLGKRMMEFSISRAKELGMKSIRLDTMPQNGAANGLYRSMGFQYQGKVYFAYKEPPVHWYNCYELVL